MRYQIRDKSRPMSRELSIEDQHGGQLFRVHGPFIRARDELRIDDMQGVEHVWIKEPVLGDRKVYEVYRHDTQVAKINLVANGSLLEGYDIVVPGSEPYQVRGGIFGNDSTIAGPRGRAAHVNWHDKHAIAVDIESGHDDVVLLASVIAMSLMTDIWSRASSGKH
jgi:uncharacterized protein YxjI